jgi:hypothetical protein
MLTSCLGLRVSRMCNPASVKYVGVPKLEGLRFISSWLDVYGGRMEGMEEERKGTGSGLARYPASSSECLSEHHDRYLPSRLHHFYIYLGDYMLISKCFKVFHIAHYTRYSSTAAHCPSTACIMGRRVSSSCFPAMPSISHKFLEHNPQRSSNKSWLQSELF